MGPDRSDVPLRKASSQRIEAGTTAVPKTERSTHRAGDGTGRKRRPARVGQPTLSGRPLLVIDGDSFAHRAYHALPKTIRRSEGKSAGAIVGFANFVLRLYADERPRAAIVGWDSLEAPTKRHEMFPAYQSGREFDDDPTAKAGTNLCLSDRRRRGARTPDARRSQSFQRSSART